MFVYKRGLFVCEDILYLFFLFVSLSSLFFSVADDMALLLLHDAPFQSVLDRSRIVVQLFGRESAQLQRPRRALLAFRLSNKVSDVRNRVREVELSHQARPVV